MRKKHSRIEQENILIKKNYDKELRYLQESIEDKTNHIISLQNHEFFYNYHKKRGDEDITEKSDLLNLYIELYSISIENGFTIICDA
jgi:hypothetical protein